MINSPVLLSIYRTTCPHFIPTTIFYSIRIDRKDKDYLGSNRQGSDQSMRTSLPTCWVLPIYMCPVSTVFSNYLNQLGACIKCVCGHITAFVDT